MLNRHTPDTPTDYALPFDELCRRLLSHIGEDPEREGLARTPQRLRKAMAELTAGYRLTPQDAVGEGIFASESSGPISVRQIEFFSLCEHHMLPFWGHVSIGYLPNAHILGLSKLARLVEIFARRLQVQERLTREIAEAIHELTLARAVVIQIEASHMCMMMRGVRKQDSVTRTEFHIGLDSLENEERGRLWLGIAP